MKLYVIYDRSTDEVIAHSRSQDLMDRYCQTHYIVNKSNITTRVVKDKATVYKIEHSFFNKVIYEEDLVNEVIVDEDTPLFDFAREEYDKLITVKKDLSNIIENYEISKSEKKELKRSLKILKALSEKKNFKKAIGVDVIVDIIKSSPGIALTRIFNIRDNREN